MWLGRFVTVAEQVIEPINYTKRVTKTSLLSIWREGERRKVRGGLEGGGNKNSA